MRRAGVCSSILLISACGVLAARQQPVAPSGPPPSVGQPTPAVVGPVPPPETAAPPKPQPRPKSEESKLPTEERAKRFMEVVRTNDTAALLAALDKYDLIPDGDLDRATGMLTPMRAIAPASMGKPLGIVEFVRKEECGPSLVRYVFVEKWSKGPVLWTFIFYKTEDGWIPVKFDFNNSIDALVSGHLLK